MKSVRTFNLDQDVINILANKPNKSQFVARAVRRLHKGQIEFDQTEIPLKTLLVFVSQRLDYDDPIRPLIIDRINKLK